MNRIIRIIMLCVILSIISCRNDNIIIIETPEGNIEVELYPEKAPATVKNFMLYADSGLFDGACFYRIVNGGNQPYDSVKIAVIQGGRYNAESPVFPPVIHETTDITGIKHLDGTISMARSGPGTATSEFFITVGDQPQLDFGGHRNMDGQGFAAFGRVTEGMETVRRINVREVPGQYLTDTIPILRIRRKQESVIRHLE